MIEYKLSLASSGAVKAPGYEDMLRFGYNKNCGVYRLRVTAADEWKGMKLRVFWHTPEGDPPASLVENGVVEVPAFVTAVSGEGRITFEGSDGTRTITSADMRYRVAANSGTEDGTMPPLGTPAWQQLVGRVEEVGADARKSAEQARKSMKQAESEKSAAAGSAAAAAKKLKELQDGIAAGDFKGEKGDTGARGPQGNTGPQGPKGEKGDIGSTGPTGATAPSIYGKQTMRQLMKQNAGVSNIEITDSNIKAFESTAKKYNIDFSLKKVKGEQTRYLVFFKGRDADVMTAAFQEFSAKKLIRDKKPSIRKALAAAKDKAKQLNAARDKVKKIDRGREI